MNTNGEPLPTLQKAACKMTVVRLNEWFDLLNIRYYEHLQKMFYIEWTDILDKGGNLLLETQVKVFKQNKKNSTNNTKSEEESNQTLFNESMPPKSNFLYVLTLYYTTNTLLIQGNLRANWVDEEYPLLKTVLHKRKEQESSMLETYNNVLEIPTLTTNKKLNQEPNITTSINEENPGKIPTMIPQIIITSPLEIIKTDNTDIPQSSPNPIKLEQLNLTTNNENRNEHVVTKINHPSETNQGNPAIPEESSTGKEIILIEMTDKSTTQLRLANEKSMKSPTKQKDNTKRKEKAKPVATIEMHENLRKVINKIDNEMIDFAKKYEQEQELINIKITDIIENLITPLKFENGKLKEALQNALEQIELLNAQILDNTTLTKNKVKETKTVMENKFKEINTNIINVKQSDKKLESKQKDMNNTEKNDSNIIKKNLKTTKDATTQTETQIEDKPHALTQKSAHNGTETLYKDKRNIYIIMDSDRKFINFKELLLTEQEETNPVVLPCGNIKRAKEILKINQIDSPHQVILYIGINDLDTQDTSNIAVKIETLAEAYQTRFNCEVFVLEVTPRGDQYNSHVNTANKKLRHRLSNSMVKRISHENLSPSHLNDDRYHRRNKTHVELLSGVQLFARNLFESITNKPMTPQMIQKILQQTKKPQFRYHSQPRNEEEEKPNIYPEKSYRSPHYQDTQQIKYWNASPHNHRNTYLYWPKNNDHKLASWQHSTNNVYALRSLLSMV